MFHGETDPLSNFFPCALRAQGRNFHSAEQLIQYRHARIAHDDSAAERIMAAPDARTAFSEAKDIPRDQRWLQLRDDVVAQAAKLKYVHCDIFRRELHETQGNDIIENTPSPYWGRGANYTGQNKMGVILQELRDCPPSPPTTPPWRQRSPCSLCGERNHDQEHCRHGRALICDFCFSSGHKARMCPLN